MAFAYDPNDPDDPETGVPLSRTGQISRREILDQQLAGQDQARQTAEPTSYPDQYTPEGGGGVGGLPPGGASIQPQQAAAGNVRDQNEVDYGNGIVGRKGADGKWYYPWGESYSDVLGDNEVAQQQQLSQFRSQYGAGSAEDDATAFAQMNGQAALKGGGMVGATGGGSGAGPVSPFTQSIRDILMQQLGQAGKAPTVDDPGIRELLAGQRLGLQRGAERQRAMAAERLAADGLADSGAAETARSGIEQQRGESEAQFTGQVLGGELNQRRQQLQSLLQMALASGDSESARAIQMQLANMQNDQFGDSLAFQYANLNQTSNLQALLQILGMV